jgi:RimJ/RimL family protein N-acetyltransferase
MTGPPAVSLPVIAADGGHLGCLEPVDAAVAGEADACERLARWRNRFRRHFLTQFEATPARTRRWLLQVVVPDPGRRLFFIRCEGGERVGTIGLARIASGRAEVDNLLRGEVGGAPRLMLEAERTLLRWAFHAFALREVTLGVFSNNVLAIGLHREVGFEAVRREPLYRCDGDDEVAYGTDAAVGARAPFDYLWMRLTRSRHDTGAGA